MSNSDYIVSARKYRPATFKNVVGQNALTHTLKNAILSGRVAQAYLFCGPRGVGKTSCARIFAKAINCLNPTAEGEACGKCENCRAIDSGSSFNVVELDAASNNGVDQMRNLTEQVQVPPQLGQYRVFIIDEVHMLSSNAFNAFLKTLEEPPRYAVFVLATTEKHKVLPTVLSRCQIYDFKRITVNDMAEHLQYVAETEGFKAEPAALNIIARKADGAMRDALSIFDQVAASTEGNITYESTLANLNILDYDYYFRLIDSFREGDVQNSLLIYKEIRDLGFDSLFFVNGLSDHVRDLMIAADSRTLAMLETADDIAGKYKQQAESLPLQWYYAALKILNDCDRDYRAASNKRLLVELSLIRLCQLLNPATPPFDLADCRTPLRSLHKNSSSAANPNNNAPAENQPQPATADAIGSKQPKSTPSVEAPVTAQTPSNLAATVSSRRRSAKAQTVSINVQTNGNQPSEINKNSEYSDEDFFAAWQNYIDTHQHQKILTTAMLNSKPSRINDDEWEVKIFNPGEAAAFDSEQHGIVDFLRQTLKNNNIKVGYQLIVSKKEKTTLSPTDLLKRMISDNPDLGQAFADMDFEVIQ